MKESTNVGNFVIDQSTSEFHLDVYSGDGHGVDTPREKKCLANVCAYLSHFFHYFVTGESSLSMFIWLRQVLAVLLLLLFSSEHVAIASSGGDARQDPNQCYYGTQETPLFFNFIAEQNEQRDRDDTDPDNFLPPDSVPLAVLRSYAGLESSFKNSDTFIVSGSIPRYKWVCSFMI